MIANRTFLSCYDKGVARAAQDDGGRWSVTTSLPELTITCLAADPANPQVVYAGTRQQGVWRSADGGLSWRAAGMQDHIIKSLAVSPHDGDVLYAGAKPALMFKSLDGGGSWQELDGFRRIPNRWWWFSPAEPPDLRPYVIAIALSPTEPEVVLAGIEFGAVVRSQDGGRTWSRHRPGARRDCHSLKFHATDGNWAYEAGAGGPSVSRDGGRTWQKLHQGLAKSYGIVCAADPGEPETWYVCAGSSPQNAFGDDPAVYLYRASKEAGWRPIGWRAHPLNGTPTALVTLPDRPGSLIAGLKSGAVWSSDDYGKSWAKAPFTLPGVWFGLLVI